MSTPGAFPAGVAEQFENLWNQVVNLHQKWQFYLDVFDNRVAAEVINDRLPGSFSIIEECVRNDMIITLYRLADVAEVFKGKKNERRNLTLRSLLDQVAVHRPAAVADLTKQLNDLDTNLEAIEEHRNKNVGHNDRDIALGTRATTLPKLERKHIEDSAKMAGAFLNCVAEHFGVAPTRFDVSNPIGDGEELIELVRRGWQHEEDQVLQYGMKPPVRWQPRNSN